MCRSKSRDASARTSKRQHSRLGQGSRMSPDSVDLSRRFWRNFAAMLSPGRAVLLVAATGALGLSTSAAPASTSQPGSTTVAGVTFVPTSAAVRRECHHTADVVGYAVPCPTLLPERLKPFPVVHGCRLEIIGAGGGPNCARSWRGWIVGEGEVLEPGYGGVLQHLGLQGAPRIVGNPVRAIDGPGAFLPGTRPTVQPRGRVRVAGRLMRWYVVPPATNRGSAFSGHLVLVWNADGHTYAYGFHVFQTLAAARALDLELVRHLVTVRPRSSS